MSRSSPEASASRPSVEVRQLIGPEIGDDETDRLGVPALRRHLSDIAERYVFVCGPSSP